MSTEEFMSKIRKSCDESIARIVDSIGYTTKTSGNQATFDSGMVRDTQTGKPRFDLIIPEGQAFEDQLLTRWARLMGRGAAHYGPRNWEKANGSEELARFRASAFRHFMQWYAGEADEDHAAAVLFNVNGAELVKQRLPTKGTPDDLP